MKDPVYKLLKTLNNYYIYDRSRNAIIRLSKDEYEEIEASKKESLKNTKIYLKLRSKGYLKDNILEQIEHHCTNFIGYILENHIEQLILQVTQRCNLRCKYCIYSGAYDDRNRTHGNYDMSLDTALNAIDFYLERANESDKYTISFYGGEPLLNFNLIKQCVSYVNGKAKNKPIMYTMTTNGTLLTEEIMGFLAENKFSILISMDGSKEEHDVNRVFANAEGSYQKIISNVRMIREKYPKVFKDIRFNTVLNPNQNFPKLKTYFEEDDLLGDSMVMMQIVESETSQKVIFSDEFYRARAFDRFKLYLFMLDKLEREHVSKLVLSDYLYIKNKYIMLSADQELRPKCHHGGPCLPGAKRLFVNVDGNFYPCEKVGENSEAMVIGNLREGFDYNKVNRLLNIGKLTSEECKKCWALHYCDICCRRANGKSDLSRENKLSYCKRSQEGAYFDLAEICVLKELGCSFDKERIVL